jgi:hypothetical protein
MTMNPEPESLLAQEPVWDFSFLGLFNGMPDLVERSEDRARRRARRAQHLLLPRIRISGHR